MPDDSALFAALRSLRSYGAIGEQSLGDAVQHADRFLVALPHPCSRLIDLGSGGGLPGLVLAMRLPDTEIFLTDRRERRTDLLRRACARLGIADRVTVITGDVEKLGKSADLRSSFDAATARSFGPPLLTLQFAGVFLTEDGVAVISEPPDSDELDRWPVESVAQRGFRRIDQDFPSIIAFRRSS